MSNAKVFIDFLGCKLNQAEAEKISYDLISRGYVLSKNVKDADYYLLNSCAVTSVAEGKTRAKLARATRQNPQIKRILIGCCGQKDRQKYLNDGLAEYVFGNLDKYDFGELLPSICDMPQGSQESILDRQRSFVSIQEGCANHCSFCIVPLLRSTISCTPLLDVVSTIRDRINRGHFEITLTGTEIGAYRDGNDDLVSLVKNILNHTDVRRLRLSSLQPHEITLPLLELFCDDERLLCPHFHMSLQSASDSVLQNMNRAYSMKQYEEALYKIWTALPNAAITTDVIAGFPAETEEDFRKTLEFCQKTPFARVHVFSYSKRPGTNAARIDGHLSEQVKKKRSSLLLEVAQEKMINFAKKHMHTNVEVYVEGMRNGLYEGYTPDYLRVCFAASQNLMGYTTNVYIKSVAHNGQYAIGSLI